MLAGVELARKRRLHHGHEARGPQKHPAMIRPSVLDRTAMDDSALLARRRLEEKLNRRSAALFPSPSASHERRSPVGIARERSRQCEHQHDTSTTMDLCPVCLDSFAVHENIMRLSCSHRFHSVCLLPWLNAHSRCPCCRRIVSSGN